MDVLILLAVLVLITAVAWRRGARLLTAGFGLMALFPALTVLRQLPSWAFLLLGAAGTALLWHRYARSAGVVTRWSARNRRRAGVASTVEIARKASVHALRARAGVVRPSLAGLSWRHRMRIPGAALGLELCRAGFQRVWCPIEDVVIVIGGPRVGKSGYLASRVLDFPGAALVTSTRTDLLTICGPQRRRTHGPVFVFNAVGLGGIESTITFDPLTGCEDPVTATERATDMLAAVSRGGSGDREFWDAQARRVLAALLHAAALGGRSIDDVAKWVSKPATGRDVPALLMRSGVAAFVDDAEQFLGINDRTQTSITTTLMPALGWLNHPPAAKAARRGRGFDVAQLLASQATVFLLGAEETQVAPLVCALTGHIAREARRLAATEPAGRLDPPLGLFLDEAALISPVPLESWSADMGGRGVTICAAFQSRSQLLARWGQHNAATILNNTGGIVLFGGTRDRDDLQFWSTLAGERDEPITTTDMNGRVASRTVRKVPVVPPAQIANLPAGRVLVIRRGIGPVLGRATMAWERRDIRWAGWTAEHPIAAARLLRALTGARTARDWALAQTRRHTGHVLGGVVGAGIGDHTGTALGARMDPAVAALLWWGLLLTCATLGIGAAMALPSLWQRGLRLLACLRRWITTVVRRRRLWGVPDCDSVTEPLPIVPALPAPGADGPVQP